MTRGASSIRILAVGVAILVCLVPTTRGAAASLAGPCKNYVACFERTGGTKGALDAKYGASGSCWSTGDIDASTACENFCRTEADRLIGLYPDAGCSPEAPARAPRSGCGI